MFKKYYKNKKENEYIKKTQAEINLGKTDENLPNFELCSLSDLTVLNQEFTKLDGEKVKLNEIKNKIIFINIWATWCVPCIAEFPHFMKLVSDFKNENIEFLFLSYESTEIIKSFAIKKGFSLPFYTYNYEDLKDNKLFKSEAIPLTIILSKDKIYALKAEGTASWSDISMNELLKNLTK